MIFYGTRGTKIKEGQINNVVCPNCDNLTSMSYGIYGRYAHLYWIPTFPIGKKTIIECNSCKKTYNVTSLPQAIKTKFEFEKQGARIPVWHFSGAILIGCIIGLIGYFSAQDNVENSEQIANPLEGDVYSLQMDESSIYSTMKVVRVTTDSVFVVYNDYETDMKSGISTIDVEKNYSESPESADSYTKEELLFYFEEGTIYDVDRD